MGLAHAGNSKRRAKYRLFAFYAMSHVTMEVRRVVLLSVILSNLLTLELSVSFNSAWTPSVTAQRSHLGILKFQDYRISVPRSRSTFYLNTSKTTETIRICILRSCGLLPANEIFRVALFHSSAEEE